MIVRLALKICSVLVFCIWVSTTLPTAKAALTKSTDFRIVIDPGHGGSDEGTVHHERGQRIAEKDITLLLSRQVAHKLRHKGYSVFLTRNNDHEVSLPARTALANQKKADLFISIHMNSEPPKGFRPFQGPVAQGVETYILNTTSDASSRRLASLENSVLGGSESTTDTPEHMDVALILKDLRLDGNRTESKRLACHLQGELASALPNPRVQNRGVKQALFHVLLGADMPSALVEAGFLSHPKDRERVLSARGQIQISNSIVAAIEKFRRLKGTAFAHSLLSSCLVH